MFLSPEKLKPQRSWFFRPATLLTIWILLAMLLILNGIYETKRAQDNLYSFLFDEGVALITGLERSVQNSFSSLSAIEVFPEVSPFFAPTNFWSLEEAVVDFVLETARRLDEEIGAGIRSESQLKELAIREKFSSLVLFPGTGKGSPPPFCLPLLEGKSSYAIERKEKPETGQVESLSIALARSYGRGLLLIHLKEKDLHFYRRRVIFQSVIEEWGEKGGIKYISFQGEDFYIWADTNPQKIGQKIEDSFLKNLFQKSESASQIESVRTSGTLEVRKLLVLRGEKVALRLGLATEKVEEIIAADRRNIFFFSLFLLVFGGLGVTLLYRLENRHLGRLKELEERINQSERLSSLANLAAAVAHEIRNPLNAISMAIQRLQREFLPPGSSEQREYFRFTDVLRGEVKRVNEIIEQFLFFAKPAKLQLAEVQILEILKDLILLIRETAEQQKIRILEEISPKLPLVKIDRQRLQEALLNLANNALQAMPDGGQLRLTAKFSADKEILIEIGDTGPGIPAENLRRIFDYYFTTKEKGMGLGLPLAHKIIKEHGGRIEVISQIGRGTTFQVFLPLKNKEV